MGIAELLIALAAGVVAALWHRRQKRQWQREVQPLIERFVADNDRRHWYRR